jgi:Fe-S cluster assembly ATPase SufC
MARAEARELHRVHKALIGEAQEYEAIKGRLSQAGRADMEKMEKVIAAATPEAVEIGMPLVWQHPVPVTAVEQRLAQEILSRPRRRWFRRRATK